MEQFRNGFSGEINRLESVRLSCFRTTSCVYFPRPIPIPQSPGSIPYVKVLLESFSQTEYLRIIYCFDDIVPQTKCHLLNLKQHVSRVLPSYND